MLRASFAWMCGALLGCTSLGKQVESRFASTFQCQKVEVVALGRGKYQASGCGKRGTYDCDATGCVAQGDVQDLLGPDDKPKGPTTRELWLTIKLEFGVLALTAEPELRDTITLSVMSSGRGCDVVALIDGERPRAAQSVAQLRHPGRILLASVTNAIPAPRDLASPRPRLPRLTPLVSPRSIGPSPEQGRRRPLLALAIAHYHPIRSQLLPANIELGLGWRARSQPTVSHENRKKRPELHETLGNSGQCAARGGLLARGCFWRDERRGRGTSVTRRVQSSA